MKLFRIVWYTLFSIRLFSSESSSLAIIHKDVRDNNLLPFLLNVTAQEEKPLDFYKKIEKNEQFQAYQDSKSFFDSLPEGFGTLRFNAKLACKSPEDNYLAIVSKENDLKVYDLYSPGKRISIYSKKLSDACCNLCITSEGLCIICFDNDKSYSFFLFNNLFDEKSEGIALKNLQKTRVHRSYNHTGKLFTEKIEYKELLESIQQPFNQNLKDNPPHLFLNQTETFLGVNAVDSGASGKKNICFGRIKDRTFAELIDHLYLSENSKVLQEIKTLDDLFKKLGICKTI